MRTESVGTVEDGEKTTAGRDERYTTFPGHADRSVGKSTPWWPTRRQPPDGAPNIVLVVTDDMGFSDIGPYGAEVDTPTLDLLASRGLRLTNYHTAPVCSPARAAMLTGLNPHRAGYGSVANHDPGFPGYTMELADNVPSLAEVLRDAGYATMAVGKWHLARVGAQNPAASRASWPLQRGFDRYYGVLEGLTNLHHPHQLVMDNSPIDIDEYPPGYYLTDDYTDHAISMIRELRAHERRQPFFLYLAHNAVHAPLHAHPEDIDRYIGRYDQGWDSLRAERFARQLELGLFPEGARLPPRNAEFGLDVPPWADTPASDRMRLARYMSVYAAMVDNVDRNLGRLLGAVSEQDDIDDTIIIFCSDNGASSEGGIGGTRSYFSNFTGPIGLPRSWVRDVDRPIDAIGGPTSLTHYPRGWAMASNTPFRLYKGQTYAGGVRVPFLISWPNGGIGGTSSGAEQRNQYLYVTDIMPTLLELIGVDRPPTREGRTVPGLDGISAVSVLRSSDAEETHKHQYIEFLSNRSLYSDGWKLVSLFSPPAPEAINWRLYDIRSDPTEIDDVSADFPDVVGELRRRWDELAWANGVYPEDDGSLAMLLAHRPDEGRWAEPVRILPGTPPLERYRSAKLIAFRDFEVTIEFDYGLGDEGVLVSHGDQGGGYLVYVEGGQAVLGYNEYGRTHQCSLSLDGTGPRVIRVRARCLPEVAWAMTMSLDDGRYAGLGPVAMLIGEAPFQGIAVGRDPRSPVLWDIHERYRSFPYSASIGSVTYTPGDLAPYDPELAMEIRRQADAALE